MEGTSEGRSLSLVRDLELPQQTCPDRGLQGKPKGKRLDRGQARAAHTSSKDTGAQRT